MRSAPVIDSNAIATGATPAPNADRPEALNPEARKNHKSSPFPLINGSGMNAVAAAAMVGAVVGLSKIFETKEERTDLNGTCTYGEPDSPMVSPCINVRVNLLDGNNSVLASSSSNQFGDFRFYIPAGESYFVQVIDRKGRTATTKMKVGRSQVVSLFLKP